VHIKFVNVTHLVALLIVSAMLSGCSTSNIVHQQISAGSKIEQVTEGREQGSYRNLYRGKQQYPQTCEANCYPAHPQVACKLPGQDCRYIGPQQVPALNSGFTLRWLGHASFMLTAADGKQLLLDPVLGQFDWPVNWASRLAGIIQRPLTPTLTAEQLAATDAVLYSHLHYDHFSHATIAQVGANATYYMPLGMAAYMPDAGYNIIEHAWYSQSQLDELTIHLLPAHHFNSRKLLNDHNQALWGGWLIEHNGKKLFFAGDTGYSQHFSDIQQRYGDIDICLLPIASYHHEQNGDWYRYVHTTPEDTLVAADELGCKVMIPWGYGNASWQMGDHSSHSALLRLLHMQQQLNSKIPLLILNEGDSVAL
jgi:N-acyl-phosphatidylethanolamine-hydrolysing phospholipase D